jgi:hypothetical protein
VKGAARIFASCVLCGVFLGCPGDAPPSKVDGAPTTPPDEQFETNGALAYRVLVWTHTPMNERVVMAQQCAEGCTGCSAWTLERTLYPGSTTSIDDKVAGKGRHPIPPGSGWR